MFLGINLIWRGTVQYSTAAMTGSCGSRRQLHAGRAWERITVARNTTLLLPAVRLRLLVEVKKRGEENGEEREKKDHEERESKKEGE